jgi:hypothetical protein
VAQVVVATDQWVLLLLSQAMSTQVVVAVDQDSTVQATDNQVLVVLALLLSVI